jgi:phosphoglycerate dehydrogenase-like enzyme
MPVVAILGEDAAELAALLAAATLPQLELVTASDGDDCERADILFGPPDALVDCLDRAPALRWAQSTWAGVTPLLRHPRRDYVLTGVKGIFGQAMTEYVLGWLLALERRIIERAGARRWDHAAEPGLAGRRLGLLGTGSIAQAVARGCATLGLRVSGLNTSGGAVAGFEACFATGDRLAFARQLDYAVSLLPDTPLTDGLVDASFLRALPPGAIFINAGRANTVVDEDLLAALSSGRLRAAVLDVTRVEPLPAGHPFWSVPSLYLSSHTAAMTSPAAIAELFSQNYRRYLRGERLRHQVDFKRGY